MVSVHYTQQVKPEAAQTVKNEGRKKMFRKLTTKTTSYKVSDFSDYIVDIEEHEEFWDAWLYRKDLGRKIYVYGVAKKDQNNYPVSHEMFIELVDASINDYIDEYEETYRG